MPVSMLVCIPCVVGASRRGETFIDGPFPVSHFQTRAR